MLTKRQYSGLVLVTLTGLVLLAGCGEKTRKPEPAETGKAKEVAPDEPEATIDLPEDPKPGDTFTNPKDGTELVFIPAGEFTMGSADTDEGALLDDEKPVHKLKVTGFWLGKYEVTNEQYRRFIRASGHPEPKFWDDDDLNPPKHPVVGVTWCDAVAYCEWVGGRLPTEAEWEYAARAGKQYVYGTSTGELSHDLANIDGTGGKDKWRCTSPVGSFPANPFGVHDMAGNVREMCSSLYKEYPYKENDGREDPDAEGDRVQRGGVWNLYGWDCRCAIRFWLSPTDCNWFSGFRCALDLYPSGSP